MAMRTIFCLRQGIHEPTEAYYRRFEVAISTAEVEKCNATAHLELNKAYENGDNEDGTEKFKEMCLIISADSERLSGI